MRSAASDESSASHEGCGAWGTSSNTLPVPSATARQGLGGGRLTRLVVGAEAAREEEAVAAEAAAVAEAARGDGVVAAVVEGAGFVGQDGAGR